MKIIELLNKIAKGEEIPNRFIYNGCLYENYQNGCYRHYDYDGRYTKIEKFVNKLCDDFCNLNDEIEIVGEDKKIEKLEVVDWNNCIHEVTHTEKKILIEINKTQTKLNETIDFLMENKQ